MEGALGGTGDPPGSGAARGGGVFPVFPGASGALADAPGTCMTCKTRALLQPFGAAWVLAWRGQNDKLLWDLLGAQKRSEELR